MISETLAVGLLGCNCTVLGDEVSREAIVVDPGYDVPKILALLAKHQLTVKQIVVTHAHIDHIASAQTLKQMTGAPIGCFHLEPEHKWTMRSWDRFMIPRPFTRIVVSWGPWTRVPGDMAAEEFEPRREELNAAIEFARLRALEHFGKASG